MDFFTLPNDVYDFGVIILFIMFLWTVIIIYKKILNVIGPKHEFNLPKQMGVSKRVDNTISELRALIKADRISLVRFHNGSEFLPNNPIWKVTSDNFVAKDGVSYEGIDGVLVSRIQSIIDPLIMGEPDESGIKIPASCEKCPKSERCRDSNNRTIRFDVEYMSGYSKMFLQERGTKTAFMATLNNPEKRVFGILMIEYIDTIDSLKEETLITQTICEFSEKLRFLFK